MASVDQLSGDLEPGERVLWSGHPPRGILFRLEDIFFVPFGFLYFSGALYFEAHLLATSGPSAVFFSLWGLPFVAFGFYLAIGRFPWDALVRGSTLYALTDRRAVILREWPTRKLRGVTLTDATEISVDEGLHGAGTVYFGPRLNLNNLPQRGGWGSDDPEFKFERIAAVHEVIRIVRSIHKQG